MGRGGARGTLALLAASLLIVGGLGGCGTSDEAPTQTVDAPTVDAPPAPASFYGVATQAALTDEDFDRMAEGGVGTVRSFFAWQALDPTAAKDDFDWSGPDAMIAGAAARGIDVFPYLFSTPEWVAQLDDPACVPATGCPIQAPSGAQSLAAWREFAAAAVTRYGPGGEFWSENPDLPETPVRTWQVWNEQNSPSAYGPAPDVANYARMLEIASEEIRSSDPGASIVVGGMFGTPFHGDPPALTSAEFLRRLYAVPGISESFDGVAAHPYAGKVESVAGQVEALRDEVTRAGDDAALWITEIGWSSSEGESPLELGAEGQAANLADAYELFLDHRAEWNLKGVIWYSWRDSTQTVICDWCAHSGLFEESALTAKPAWETFESLPRE